MYEMKILLAKLPPARVGFDIQPMRRDAKARRDEPPDILYIEILA
jgi:hypothetical protein